MVVEIFVEGIDKLLVGIVFVMVFFGCLGIVLVVLEKVVLKSGLKWVLSFMVVGLVFVIFVYYFIVMCFGGILVWILGKWIFNWIM